MRVVMPVALPEMLRLRKQTGADRFDEMWEGVLHLPPAPNRDYQDTASGGPGDLLEAAARACRPLQRS